MCHLVTCENLVYVFVPVVQVIFAQCLESRIETLVENFQFIIALWAVRGREDAVYAKLLEYVIHKLILEFHAIVGMCGLIGSYC